MSGCDFVKIPTVTTSVEGPTGWHWELTATSSVYSTTATEFRIYLRHDDPDLSNTLRQYATELMWNVDWIAVGFTC